MDNIILSGMLREFVIKNNLENDNQDLQFEKFVNYCLLKSDHYDSFEFDKVSTGECIGVDGIAISIGGIIIDEMTDLESFTRAQFEVKFIFSQSKTSTKFNFGDFLKFTSTVKTFFGKDRQAVPTQLHKAFDLKTYIYNKSAKLKNLPRIELDFVYTGHFDNNNNDIISQKNVFLKDMQSIPYLSSSVTCDIYDGDAIAKLYRETQNDIFVEIPFERHVSLPKIKGAKSAYLGVVKCSDYVKIIQKSNGDINKGLFFENVRDFLGNQNLVNDDIAQTIKKTEGRDRFAILNNGLTIVAKGIVPSGDNFQLSQFQVVNGCQTSHVLYNNRKLLTDDMYVTIKLVETTDIDLSGQVISTTNSQSQVTKEAFATIRPYHRLVEDFFNAMRNNVGYEYYYERRPHQYDHEQEIKQQFITSAPTLIKSFVSTVLEEPHKVHYYYGTLLSEYNQKKSSELFSEDDYPGLYFAAHHITFKTKGFANKDRQLREWSFHLALLIKRAIAPELHRGMAIIDKRFLQLMIRIDDKIEPAFNAAARFLKSKKINEKENRNPEVTKTLIDDFMQFLSKNPIEKNVKNHSKPSDNRFKLKNGEYIGIIDNIAHNKRKIHIQHGPFKIEGDAINDSVLQLTTGDKVLFKIRQDKITVEPYIHIN
ncbi:AIPR family protein [Pectobacterium polonicum]|uniref:AIPR family protein n=1 Tax=Pectobacterium polonicum TaxID=2485124 RepID=A0AAE9NUH3_9GAMM|nr:AIPR family protein [Pectobacterium polonicum]UVO08956.1 AIPR family protein [Pectobacterium polonicum]